MGLADHYDRMWEKSVKQISEHNVIPDDWIDAPDDDRFGMTLLLRPGLSVKKKVASFLQTLKTIEPSQYYYPAADQHVTVLSIISCTAGFDLNQVNVQDYITMIEEVLANHKDFDISFRGITLSPSGILLQGFISNKTLNIMRDDLRKKFKTSQLRHSIDSRYPLYTAHSTVARFREKLNSPDNFIRQLEKYRGFDFGTNTVASLELVFNDWYQRERHVKLIHRFKLG